jgi:hypothetical protein
MALPWRDGKSMNRYRASLLHPHLLNQSQFQSPQCKADFFD